MRSKLLNFSFLVVLASMPVAGVPAWASVYVSADRANPFLTLQEEDFYGQDYSEAITSLKLSGVFFSPGKSYAVIDGKIVRENESINDKRVISITDKEVLLQNSSGAKFTLKVGAIRQKIDNK